MKIKKLNLDELLAKCEPDASMPKELVDWDNMPPIGKEFGAEGYNVEAEFEKGK